LSNLSQVKGVVFIESELNAFLKLPRSRIVSAKDLSVSGILSRPLSKLLPKSDSIKMLNFLWLIWLLRILIYIFSTSVFLLHIFMHLGMSDENDDNFDKYFYFCLYSTS
jgi:hypothetical protein